jgi:hypothetical protein
MKRAVKDTPLTEMQLKFVANWEGNQTDAARKAGYKQPNVTGAKLMKRPNVKAAIDAKQAAMIQSSGETLAKDCKVGRNDVIKWLANVAEHALSEFARVGACGHLADIFGMKVKQTRDVTDLFEGWNDDDLEAYSRTGVIPQRFDRSASASPASIQSAQ